jgi:uncharacterized protein (DUF3084 family)
VPSDSIPCASSSSSTVSRAARGFQSNFSKRISSERISVARNVFAVCSEYAKPHVGIYLSINTFMSFPRSITNVGFVVFLAVLPAFVSAQASKNDPIMSKDELRACMKAKQSNEDEAASIKTDQETFKRDYDAFKTEQTEINKQGDDLRGRATAISVERDVIATRASELQTRVPNLKTDEEKAKYEADRAQLLERSQMLDRTTAKFNEDQQSYAKRVEVFNGRIGPINERNKTVNSRVEPLEASVDSWRKKCGNRRYREDDEIAIKKELTAKK